MLRRWHCDHLVALPVLLLGVVLVDPDVPPLPAAGEPLPGAVPVDELPDVELPAPLLPLPVPDPLIPEPVPVLPEPVPLPVVPPPIVLPPDVPLPEPVPPMLPLPELPAPLELGDPLSTDGVGEEPTGGGLLPMRSHAASASNDPASKGTAQILERRKGGVFMCMVSS
jgi:hypothetical protein